MNHQFTPVFASIIFWGLAAFFYAILSILKFRWSESVFNTPKWEAFSDPNRSWKRKFKRFQTQDGEYSFIGPPINWYYKFFRIKYKEKFLGSATIFVAFTDLYHAAQWCMILCLSGSVGMIYLLDASTKSVWLFLAEIIAYRTLWAMVHEYCFSRLLIRKVAR